MRYINPTKIPWADFTWNPVTGCTPISDGCDHCYAQAILHRFKKPQEVTFHPERLAADFSKIKRPSRIFVCSMADLFHQDVPTPFIMDVLAVCAAYQQHTFILLTKRPERMWAMYRKRGGFPPNVWFGVTIESQKYMERWNYVEDLAGTKFISVEPMLGPVVLPADCRPDWLIAGSETGPGARYCNPQWMHDLHYQCFKLGVPFFFKQLPECDDQYCGFKVRQYPKGAESC